MRLRRTIARIAPLLILGCIISLIVAISGRFFEHQQHEASSKRYRTLPTLRLQPDLDDSFITAQLTTVKIDIRYPTYAGWPVRSFQAFHNDALGRLAIGVWQRGVEIPMPAGSAIDTFVLPIQPILSGFVINAIIFAAGLWLVQAAATSARNSFRCRCLRCVNCNYDLRGSTNAHHTICPECGHPPISRSAKTNTNSSLQHCPQHDDRDYAPKHS